MFFSIFPKSERTVKKTFTPTKYAIQRNIMISLRLYPLSCQCTQRALIFKIKSPLHASRTIHSKCSTFFFFLKNPTIKFDNECPFLILIPIPILISFNDFHFISVNKRFIIGKKHFKNILNRNVRKQQQCQFKCHLSIR